MQTSERQARGEAVAEWFETPNFPERVGCLLLPPHTIAVRTSPFLRQPSLLQLLAASSLIKTTFSTDAGRTKHLLP
jgi:hypothetical protein